MFGPVDTGGGSLSGGNPSATSGVSGDWIQNKGSSTMDKVILLGTVAGAFVSIITLVKMTRK